ncbi:phosphate/phosphite/phosphonate ABC transporter substrate-binding protein [Amycolatopsis sp. K13G38]|uniref:Phosphate/phosphite/phosphonate ABC transporter substrate-binding protein n=1 Tax=Amycolatopsis acididurans TaxID=2724524 RepID=A0ABX1JDQ7_9PSEU|nr:PhnD/SsuA/transferrin family substrate-binding protein [Amycolatopsis acididurans]NKQ57788.1 phosphate/phosphite/phosphonate ABC transporter substrate-binding protein [Amycolatopsis acididurans]
MKLRLGLVARGAQTLSAWTTLEGWLLTHGLLFEFVLYLTEERLIEDAVDGRIDLAFVLPLTWVRTRRRAEVLGRRVRPLVMRECDRDEASLILVRADSAHRRLTDLRDQSVGVGQPGPPVAALVPELMLRKAGLVPGNTVDLRAGPAVGEQPVQSLLRGELDAMALDRRHYGRWTVSGAIPPGTVRVLARSGRYDAGHIMVTDVAPAHLVSRLATLLLAMPSSDHIQRVLGPADMAHWNEGRAGGYQVIETAVDELGFCDRAGRLIA